MNLYKITDESPDANKDPVVFVQSEKIEKAMERAIRAMTTPTYRIQRVKITIERICDLDRTCKVWANGQK